MAICQVCIKSKLYGHNVSHSKHRTKRVFQPNIFRKRMDVNGKINPIKICTNCLKRIKKFGEIRAEEEFLGSAIIKVVNWQKLAQEKALAKTQKEQKVKVEEKKEEKKAEEKSIKELVGKKRSKKAETSKS